MNHLVSIIELNPTEMTLTGMKSGITGINCGNKKAMSYLRFSLLSFAV